MDRKTQQRSLLIDLFKKHDVPLSPNEVFKLAKKQLPSLGLATVYRFIQEFLEEEFLVIADIPGRAKKYELAGKGHHHFFECKNCHKLYEIKKCPGNLEKMVPKGFLLQSHEIILFGFCKSCTH